MRYELPRDDAAELEATYPGARPHARRFLVHTARVIPLLIALAGCAGARVSNIASARAAGPAPSELLVAVDAASAPDDTQAQAAHRIAADLQADLVQRLARAKVTAEPFVPATEHPGAAVLHVTIVRADPGSLAKRLVVGFGFGRATLQARAELQEASPSGVASLTAFDTSSDSGIKPGLILPGGVALATGNAVHLAIGGGIDIATNLRGGLARPTTRTASAIVTQLRQYYASAGWQWPGDDKS